MIGPLPHPEDAGGAWVGRAWDPAAGGPCLVAVRDGRVMDITTAAAPTMRDLLELDDPAGFAATVAGRDLGSLEAVAGGGEDGLRLLAPCDLQAVKACGVTFARSSWWSASSRSAPPAIRRGPRRSADGSPG